MTTDNQSWRGCDGQFVATFIQERCRKVTKMSSVLRQNILSNVHTLDVDPLLGNDCNISDCTTVT
jgi:hypothetical protein